MAVKTKTQLKADNDTLITTNGSGDITGAILNGFEEDVIDSYEDVIQSYTYADMLAIASPATYQKVIVTDFTPTAQVFIYTGTFWKPICGCVVLNVNATQTGTNADTVEKTLATYTLPANYLNQNLDYIDVIVSGQFAADNNDKSVKMYFGSSTFTIVPTGTDANSKYWTIHYRIIRTGAATQVITGNFNARPRAGGVASVLGIGAKAAGTETLSSAVVIKVTGTNTASVANDILFDEWTITLHRK